MDKRIESSLSKNVIKKRESLDLAKQRMKDSLKQTENIQPMDKKPTKASKLKDTLSLKPNKEYTNEHVNNQIKQFQTTGKTFATRIDDFDHLPEGTGLSRKFVKTFESAIQEFKSAKDGIEEYYGNKQSDSYKEQKRTAKQSLENINAAVTTMMTHLESWRYITQATDKHIGLLKDNPNTSNVSVESQRQAAIAAYEKLLNGYKDGKFQEGDQKAFQDIADWFQKPREEWDKEVSAIVSQLEKSDKRAKEISNNKSTDYEKEIFFSTNTLGEITEDSPLLEQRLEHREFLNGNKNGKIGMYKLASDLRQLLVDEPYKHLDNLRQDGITLLKKEMGIFKKAAVKGANTQAEQWEKIANLFDNLKGHALDGQISSDDIVKCRTQYFEGYGKYLASLYEAHKAEEANNSEDQKIESYLANNRIQEVHLELELMNLKITDKLAFNQINPVKEQWEKNSKDYYSKFNADHRKLGTFVTQLERVEAYITEAINYCNKGDAILKEWENTYIPAHQNFLQSMRETVKADTSNLLDQKLKVAQKIDKGVYSNLKKQYSQLQSLLDQISKAHPELRHDLDLDELQREEPQQNEN